MKPHNRTDRAAIRLYCGCRYTIVTIVNDAQPRDRRGRGATCGSWLQGVGRGTERSDGGL